MEAFNAENLRHDLVVIACTVVTLGVVAVDQFDKFVPVALADQVCEVLQVQQNRNIVHTAQAQKVDKADLIFV